MSERTTEGESLTQAQSAEETSTKDGKDHRLCEHAGDCIRYTLLHAFRAFGTGVSVKMLIFATGSLIRRKLPDNANTVQELWNACRFGAFLGTCSATYNSAHCGLSRWRGREDGWNAVFAGALAGATVAMEPEFRRGTWALYALSKAVYPAHYVLSERRIIPRVPYGIELMYVAESASIIWVFLNSPRCKAIMPFYRITSAMTGMKDDEIDRISNVIRHGCSAHEYCAAYHPSFDSCLLSFLSRFVRGYKTLLKAYSVLYFVFAILLPVKAARGQSR